MKILLFLLLISNQALAHESLVPHQHPHGASALPDTKTLVLGGALVLCFWMAARWLRKE